MWESFVENCSVNYTELAEFNYVELIYYKVEQSFLLETTEVITKGGIFYKVGQVLKSESNIITKQGNFALLESGTFLFQSVANNLLQS